jgi:hypothetical protein
MPTPDQDASAEFVAFLADSMAIQSQPDMNGLALNRRGTASGDFQFSG